MRESIRHTPCAAVGRHTECAAYLGQRHGRRLLDVGETFFQQLGHFFGRLETVLGPLRHELGDDPAKPLGDFRIDLADRPGLFVGDPPQHAVARLGPERRPAGTHRVEHAAQAEQVAPLIDRLAAGLLGRHVLRRAGDDAGLRQAGVVGRAGEAEVGQLHPLDAVGQEDVGRLHVAVNEPLGMGGGQPGGGLHADAEDFGQRQRPVVVQPPLQRRPADVGHDEIGQPGRFRHAVDFDHVVVDHGGGGLGLAGESLLRRSAAAQVRGEDLDRHVAVQGGVEAPSRRRPFRPCRRRPRLHTSPSGRASDRRPSAPRASAPWPGWRKRPRLSNRNRPTADRREAVARLGGTLAFRTICLRWRRSFPTACGNRRSRSSAIQAQTVPRRSASDRGTVGSAADRRWFGTCSLCYLLPALI